MKKEYVRPESHLFVINLSENIAVSPGEEEYAGGKVSVIPVNGVRCYTGVEGAPVRWAKQDLDYLTELDEYVHAAYEAFDIHTLMALYKCSK